MRGWWPIPALVATALLIAAIDGDSGLRTWWQLRGDLSEARARIDALREDVGSRQEVTSDLQDDEFEIERAIRERLEYVKSGETLVRLSPGDDTTVRFE